MHKTKEFCRSPLFEQSKTGRAKHKSTCGSISRSRRMLKRNRVRQVIQKKRSSQLCLCPVLVLLYFFISDSTPLHRHANRTKFSKPEYITSGKLSCNANPNSDELLSGATIVILPFGQEADFSVVAAAAALFPISVAIGNDRDYVLRNSAEHGPSVIRLLSQGNCILYAPGGIFECADVYAKAMVEWVAKIGVAKANLTKTKKNLARQKSRLRELQQLATVTAQVKQQELVVENAHAVNSSAVKRLCQLRNENDAFMLMENLCRIDKQFHGAGFGVLSLLSSDSTITSMAALSTRELVEHGKDAVLKLCLFLELSDDATQDLCDGEQVLLESVKVALDKAETTLERQVIAAAFCARAVSTHMEANYHGKKQVWACINDHTFWSLTIGSCRSIPRSEVLKFSQLV